MLTEDALNILSALGHPTRLEAFRMLVRHEPEGLSTGDLVEASGLSQSTFSTHLAVLVKAGLVLSEKRGRQHIQRANIDGLRGLMVFLAKDCCQGRAELCDPLLAELTCCLKSKMTDIIIYHNPDCGTSRNTLAMIRNAGIEPHVIEYLKTPPSRALLKELIERAGISPRALLREKGTPFADLRLGREGLDDEALIDAMMEHPVLINRPLVVSPLGVKLCLPSEVVLDIIPAQQRRAFTKEDGERVVDENGRLAE